MEPAAPFQFRIEAGRIALTPQHILVVEGDGDPQWHKAQRPVHANSTRGVLCERSRRIEYASTIWSPYSYATSGPVVAKLKGRIHPVPRAVGVGAVEAEDAKRLVVPAAHETPINILLPIVISGIVAAIGYAKVVLKPQCLSVGGGGDFFSRHEHAE